MKRFVKISGLIIFTIFLNSLLFAGLTAKQIYQKMGKGVVLIVASQEDGVSSIGTGSIISSKGLIITNNHVITNEKTGKPFKKIGIFLKPDNLTGNKKNDLKKFYTAEVLSRAEEYDLALLKINGKLSPKDFTVLELGDVSDIIPGDEGIAIGHPEQGGLWTLTKGVISNRFVDYKGIKGWNVFQMETSINRGNSGGPLFDERGYVIGVNTMMARKSSDGLAITGINFAVMSSTVKNWLENQGTNISYGKTKYDKTDLADASQEKEAIDKGVEEMSMTGDEITSENGRVKERTIKESIEVKPGLPDETKEEIAEEKNETEKELEEEAFNIKIIGDVKKDLSLKKKMEKRKNMKIEMDFKQTKRPYSYDELIQYYEGLKTRVKGATDELDRQINEKKEVKE